MSLKNIDDDTAIHLYKSRPKTVTCGNVSLHVKKAKLFNAIWVIESAILALPHAMLMAIKINMVYTGSPPW